MSAVESPGCVILLIDESASMESSVQQAPGAVASGQTPKSKSASVATAVNAMLKRLGDGPDFDIALIGYYADGDLAIVESRWDGPLGGRSFVPVREIAESPVQVEERVRRIPNPAGFGPPVEQEIQFPVWYAATPNGQACQVAAFHHCRKLLEEWLATAGTNPGTPLIIHVLAGGSSDGNPHQAVQEIMNLDTGGVRPILIQAHLSTSATVPPTLYPSNGYYLPAGSQKDLFSRCGELPAHLATELKASEVTVNENAVGMLYNARMLDIVTLLKLVDAHTKNWPARPAATQADPVAASTPEPDDQPTDTVGVDESSVPTSDQEESESAETEVPTIEPDESLLVADDEPILVAELDDEPSGSSELVAAAQELERAALLVIVLDRSLTDPFNAGTGNSCSRLQENANSLLGRLSQKPTDVIDVAVVSYGTDVAGDIDVRCGFEGSLAGQNFVRDSDLLGGALRIDEFTKKVSDGIGGMMERPVKQPVYLELEPAAAGSPVKAFETVSQIVGEWCGQHPASIVPPVVLHLTRGQGKSDDIEQCAASLTAVQPVAGAVLLYHLIATEDAHTSIVFADQLDDGESEEIRGLFAHSSLMLERERLAIEKPAIVNSESRGFVINGKIDLILDTVLEILANPE